jgi:hypothetical protein
MFSTAVRLAPGPLSEVMLKAKVLCQCLHRSVLVQDLAFNAGSSDRGADGQALQARINGRDGLGIHVGPGNARFAAAARLPAVGIGLTNFPAARNASGPQKSP